ncbi:MAG: hypothetical protein KDK78_01700 [Chlamydiia bacterium]|nr:hypothetical protein [Chlamydiia bacterium]
MRQPEEDLLLALWGESTDRVPVQDLQVLAERFDRRSKYTDAPDRATRVAATLRKAAAETRSSTAQARIEDALIDWAPDALLLRELQTLMQQYRPFSEGVKVSSKDFSGLDASYQRLGAWMPKIQAVRPQEGLYVAVANMVKAAESGTKQAEKESSSGHFDTAIFMLQGAREEIRLALASLRNARQLQSVLILSDAVDAQQFALRLNEALDRVGSMEGSRKVLLDQLKTSQNRALQQIEPFTQSAAQELKVDQDALKSDGLPSPWERVMALYDKGKESADNAKLSLFKEYPDTPKALSDQNDAYKRWREALDLLRPESNEGAPQDQDSDASEGEEQNRDSEERRPPSASTQQALQLLQQMEMEDAPKSEKPAGVKQGLRPW